MYRLENVTKRYSRRGEEVVAFAADELAIAPGEYVAIVGPSGSGKTTLLSMLGGMLAPTTGEVWLRDVPLYSRSVVERAKLRREQIGFVFQSFNLVPYLTALENVQVPLCLAGFSDEEQVARATGLLEQLGLGDRLRHKPSELSVGQQQRVALARTLVHSPRIILADEPTGNLDPTSRAAVLDAFRTLHKTGTTIILVTHDPVVAQQADRQLTLQNGRLMGVQASTDGDTDVNAA
jgi:putative ABC transport system ATP-binding protein